MGAAEPPASHDRLDGAVLHARGLRELYLLCLAVGFVGLGLVVAFEDFRDPFTIFVFVTATLLGAYGLLDRRVKLSLSRDGIRYLRWGSTVIPWHEFSAYRLVRWRSNPYVQLVPRRPERVLQNFSWLGRLNNRCARLIGQPTFSVAVTPLAITDRQLEAMIGEYLPRARMPAP